VSGIGRDTELQYALSVGLPFLWRKNNVRMISISDIVVMSRSWIAMENRLVRILPVSDFQSEIILICLREVIDLFWILKKSFNTTVSIAIFVFCESTIWNS
jgi:hypothetical protein